MSCCFLVAVCTSRLQYPFDFAAENPFAFITGLQCGGVFWLSWQHAVKPVGSLLVPEKCPHPAMLGYTSSKDGQRGKICEGFWTSKVLANP